MERAGLPPSEVAFAHTYTRKAENQVRDFTRTMGKIISSIGPAYAVHSNFKFWNNFRHLPMLLIHASSTEPWWGNRNGDRGIFDFFFSGGGK
jgi:hypothetical protein